VEHRPRTGPRPAAAEAIARLRRRILGERRRAVTLALAPHARAVGAATAAGTRPGRRYWGDCYRRAAEYVLARIPPAAGGPGPPPAPPAPPAPAGLRVVHGTCRAGPQAWAHAWVELPGGLVFCGVRQAFYDRAGYRRVLGAAAEAVYRPEELVARLRATGRYGPWHRGAPGAGRRGRDDRNS
jgi:hypothetical protein